MIVRSERRCMVGVGPNGENTFAQYVRADWADAKIARLQTMLERIVAAQDFVVDGMQNARLNLVAEIGNARALLRASDEPQRAVLPETAYRAADETKEDHGA